MYLTVPEHGQDRSHRRQVRASFVIATRAVDVPQAAVTAVANSHQRSAAVAQACISALRQAAEPCFPGLRWMVKLRPSYAQRPRHVI